MIDKNYKYFYTLKHNPSIEKMVVYRIIGLISCFAYFIMIVGIFEMRKNALITEMWILISLIIIEKLGFLIYYYTHPLYSKWYYHLIWDIFHFDLQNVFADDLHNRSQNNLNNQNAVQNKYNLKIPLNLLNSVVIHYSALSFIQNSDLPQSKQMNYMIISIILLFTNQVLLFQRLYFRNLINLHQYIYMAAEGLAYQYSQLSLLSLIQEVGNKWYVYIIAFIFAAVSLSMILERNTHLYFTESLIYLMISQVFGLRLDAEFLYSKHNDRCQKIFSLILYGCFSIIFWISLLLLVIIFGGSKLYYLNYSILIGIMATAFFFLPQMCLIMRYFWKSPIRIVRTVNKMSDIEEIKKGVNPLTKIIEVTVIQYTEIDLIAHQKKVIEKLVATIIFTNKDILYNLNIWNHQKDTVLSIESVYDSQKIRVVAIKMVFENITSLELVCSQIENQHYNYYEFIINLQNFLTVRNQALSSLIKFPLICLHISKLSNVVRGDESFQKHCATMKQTVHQIAAMHKSISNILCNNPHSIYYDLFDEIV